MVGGKHCYSRYVVSTDMVRGKHSYSGYGESGWPHKVARWRRDFWGYRQHTPAPWLLAEEAAPTQQRALWMLDGSGTLTRSRGDRIHWGEAAPSLRTPLQHQALGTSCSPLMCAFRKDWPREIRGRA